MVILHKNRAEILCTLPIDKNAARHNRRRAAEIKKGGNPLLSFYFRIAVWTSIVFCFISRSAFARSP